ARVRVFCWGEVRKIMGVVSCGGEAAGKGKNSAVRGGGKKVSGVNSRSFKRGEMTGRKSSSKVDRLPGKHVSGKRGRWK
nr:hypothetical protein [Tanacetum cinerariifolium]